MSYIGEIRKFVGHAPIMAVAAMGILYNEEKGLLLEKEQIQVSAVLPVVPLSLANLWKKHLKEKSKKKQTSILQIRSYLI